MPRTSSGWRFARLIVAASAAACGSHPLTAIEAPDDSGAGASSRSTAGSSSSTTAVAASRSSSGAASGDAGGAAACKRGVAANTAPSVAFAPTSTQSGVAWWYDWSTQGASPSASIAFVPMIWGTGSLSSPLSAGSAYVLGFNEPNFKSQSNLTPAMAAAAWSTVETSARGVGARIVSPGMNYCGSAADSSQCSDPTVTDPYTWLKDFFTACSGCQVDAVAVHWYNCDLTSLQDYIEGNLDAGGTFQGFVQFGKPIWLTEFACDTSHSVADQKAYMQAAVPWLEANAHVARYSWFSASNIPNAMLANSDGSPTDLGTTYVSLPQSCP